MDQFTREELCREESVFQIGALPRRIDIMTSLSGLSFAEAWARRKGAAIDGVETQIIDKADLIRNKKAAGRPKDLADAAALEELSDSKP